MPQETASIDSAKVAKPVHINWQRGGLRWKISIAFSGLILIVGLAVIGIVYHFAGSALQRQFNLRLDAIATNLSDAAAGLISSKSKLELDALIAKYGRLDGVAYAIIQDPKGGILVSSMQPFPTELKENGTSAASTRTTRVRGKDAFETRVPVLEGQLGTVRVGLWADNLRGEMRATLMPILGLIAACVMAGIALSMMLAARAVRPILQLRAIADDISRGRLDTSVTIQSDDEIGELGRSLERMRASLKAAMARLHRQ